MTEFSRLRQDCSITVFRVTRPLSLKVWSLGRTQQSPPAQVRINHVGEAYALLFVFICGMWLLCIIVAFLWLTFSWRVSAHLFVCSHTIDKVGFIVSLKLCSPLTETVPVYPKSHSNIWYRPVEDPSGTGSLWAEFGSPGGCLSVHYNSRFLCHSLARLENFER